jgi:hypothetical protein
VIPEKKNPREFFIRSRNYHLFYIFMKGLGRVTASKSTLAIKAACFAMLLVGSGPAFAASSDAVQCVFGVSEKRSTLTLLAQTVLKKSRSRPVEISAFPGQKAEREAIARYVGKQDSEIGRPYIQVLFNIDDQTGFVTQIADNGHAVTYPIDLAESIVGDKSYGACKNHQTLFNLWH